METLIRPHTVKIFECDRKKRLRLHCLFNLLQDVADEHADALGVGYDFCLSRGIGWVGANYHLKIDRLPQWRESFSLSTWASGKTAVSGIRDFKAETPDGEILFRASSQWALIDLVRGRPVSVTKNLSDYVLRDERMIDTDFPVIPLPEREDSAAEFSVRYDDIDINDHVNNAVYPLWAQEGLPHDFVKSRDVVEMEIAFKKPALLDDKIKSVVQIDNDVLMTTHRIASSDSDKDFARVRIRWK